MDKSDRDYLNNLATKVIGAGYEVANVLGPGFLERVYEKALVHELSLQGISASSQAPVPVFYKGVRVGRHFADVLVEGALIVEIKCVEGFSDGHMAQCINYLKATEKKLCLIINFQRPKVEWKRIVRNF
jgi:GxxExxY protein